MQVAPWAALALGALAFGRCERTQEVTLTVKTDSPVDLAISCPHLSAHDALGKTPYGPFQAHVGDTLLFTLEDAGFYYAESVMPGDPGKPQVLERAFALPAPVQSATAAPAP